MKSGLRRARPWLALACFVLVASAAGADETLEDLGVTRLDSSFPRALDLIPGVPEYEELATDPSPLELELRAAGIEVGGNQRAGLDGSWLNSFDIHGNGELPADTHFEFESRVVDVRSRLGGTHDHFEVSEMLDWERSTFTDTTLKVSLLDGRLRFTTRHGLSNYGVVRDDDLLARRFDGVLDLGDGARELDEMAQALVQRVDASLWKSEALRVSAFGVYRDVDESFQRLTAAERRARKKSPFGRAGLRSTTGGLGLASGPFGLKLSYTSTEDAISDTDGERGPSERGYRADGTVSLERLRGAAGGWSWLVPGSLWLTYAEGTVQPSGESSGTRDATRDLSAGFTWSAKGASLSLGAWHSSYDGQQPGSEAADWVGRGIDCSLALYRARWEVYADASVGRYQNLDPWNATAEQSVDASMQLAYRPKWLPDLAAALAWSRYRTDYVAWEDFSESDAWSAQASLDFSKYLSAPDSKRKRPSLRATYRFERSATLSGSDLPTSDDEHAAMVTIDFHI